MPHVDIKCFPRELTDEQKTALAADITEVLIRHLNSKESAVSVALTQVEPDAWQAVAAKSCCFKPVASRIAFTSISLKV